ncbi:hypothetical protein [Paenibacillus sp. YYML68]|uniref:hypothetical protein n=1 Tax=Paenibacillus sp. YYML68 TaxID=2909250 RepID=UPI0024912C2D|nr:hypothetical protein [Paenibacillus sp. YYML68]
MRIGWKWTIPVLLLGGNIAVWFFGSQYYDRQARAAAVPAAASQSTPASPASRVTEDVYPNGSQQERPAGMLYDPADPLQLQLAAVQSYSSSRAHQ